MDTASVRVIVVEDHEIWRHFFSTALQKEPELRVIAEVSDGLKAVQKVEELQPDLILLDIGLPTLNGIEAARRIREVSYVKVIGTDKPLRLTSHPAPALSAAWSPDGRSIAFRRVDLDTENGGIFVVSALGGPERKLASTNDQFISRAEISWSPDGTQLAFADHAQSSGGLSTQLFM